MNLLKTSFWSASMSVVKIVAGMIVTKIMAIYLGPAGVALLGNYTNITGILSTFSNGAIGSGITKYISDFDTDKEKQNVISLSFKVTVISSLLIGILTVVFHKLLARFTFSDVKYSSVYIIFGITLIFFGLNTTLTSILNGFRYIKQMTIAGMLGSIVSVILAIVITMRFGLYGALLNTIIAQVFIFFINVFYVNRLKIIDYRMILKCYDTILLVKLLKYAAMSIVSIIVVPTSMLLIRKYILINFSTEEAGYIQAVWSISTAYLTIATTTLSVYYLPTYSSIKEEMILRKEVIRGYKFLIPIVVISGVTIFLCKDLIIYILYTPAFLEMRKYFIFQIIGDSIKIASWILSYLMVAKAMTKWFILTEIIFSVTYVCLSCMLMGAFGSIAVTYAYAINYFIYLSFLLFLFRKLLFKRKAKQDNTILNS